MDYDVVLRLEEIEMQKYKYHHNNVPEIWKKQ